MKSNEITLTLASLEAASSVTTTGEPSCTAAATGAASVRTSIIALGTAVEWVAATGTENYPNYG